MELTPGRQAKHPNSTQAGWDALANGLRCLTCFDGKGNGYCSDHAGAAMQRVMEGVEKAARRRAQDADEAAMQRMEVEDDER